MNYIINTIKSTIQTVAISNITNKKPYSGIALIKLCHFPLFHFISGKYYNLIWLIFAKNHFNKFVAKRASATC